LRDDPDVNPVSGLSDEEAERLIAAFKEWFINRGPSVTDPPRDGVGTTSDVLVCFAEGPPAQTLGDCDPMTTDYPEDHSCNADLDSGAKLGGGSAKETIRVLGQQRLHYHD